MQSKPKSAPRPRPPVPAIPLHLARCPFCRDDVTDDAQVVCAGCLARHHDACWDESPSCAACGHGQALAPARDASPRVRRLLTVLVVLAVFAGVRAVVARVHAPRPQVAPRHALEVAEDQLLRELVAARTALAAEDWPGAYASAHAGALAVRLQAKAQHALAPSSATRTQLRVAEELVATFRFDGTFDDLVAAGDVAGQEASAREALRIVEETLPGPRIARDAPP